MVSILGAARYAGGVLADHLLFRHVEPGSGSIDDRDEPGGGVPAHLAERDSQCDVGTAVAIEVIRNGGNSAGADFVAEISFHTGLGVTDACADPPMAIPRPAPSAP